MILFADPGNSNIRFYEVLGGERILDKQGKLHGAFGWNGTNKWYELCFVGCSLLPKLYIQAK